MAVYVLPHANRIQNGIQMFEPHMQAKITFPTIKKKVRKIAIVFFLETNIFVCYVLFSLKTQISNKNDSKKIIHNQNQILQKYDFHLKILVVSHLMR